MDEASIDVLEERFVGLRTWLDERFSRMDDRFDQLCADRGEDQRRMEALECVVEERFDDHESRLVRLERLAWMVVAVFTFFSPVVVWAVIEIIKALF